MREASAIPAAHNPARPMKFRKPSPELFEMMAQRARDYAIFLLDPEGRIMSWNVGAQALKGYEPDEIIGKHFSIFYPEEVRQREWPKRELEMAVLEGRFEDEGWRIRKDGSRFWANVVITALRSETGDLLAFSKITRDLTLRREQEERMRHSEERFRLLVDSVTDYAIYMLDKDGLVVSWNAGAQRIKGYAAADIIGRHYSRFFILEDIEAGAPWKELVTARTEGRAEVEGWRVRSNGERFWARAILTPIHDATGHVTGFAKVTQDLTQQRHTEQVEMASQRIHEFIAMLAHELRNPLAPIQNAAEAMQRMPLGDPAIGRLRDIISRQSKHLTRIVEDLLDITRVTRGTLSLEQAHLDSREIVARGVEIARPAMDAAGHTLEIVLPEKPVHVTGDPDRLTQVLSNLLNNASRYTPPNGSISVSVNEEDSEVIIRVRDNGRGIDSRNLERIFNLFDQGDTVLPTAAGGLGIGLSLARRVVEMHGGTIQARSAGVNQGSEFVIRLPIARRSEAQPAEAEAPQPAELSLARWRVLVVDDNVDAATTLQVLVKSDGHETLVVHDGFEALRAVASFKPDIVFLDIGMPGIDGYEVARRLRDGDVARQLVIVAVSGWKVPEARWREAGFDFHLAKPVHQAAIRKLLESQPVAAAHRGGRMIH
jgi:PAS domain S-box-containing protein